MKIKVCLAALASLAAIILGACSAIDAGGTINEDPPALHGDFSGKGFSGAYAVIPAAGDIPHVPASKGKRARISQVEIDQILYLDGHCQSELFKQLPGWAQAIVKEGGWSALVVAVGQTGFASFFPGADLVRYFLGGLGYGFAAGTNTGRYRQDSSEKSSQAYCMILQAWDAKRRYPGTLEGVQIIPWYGNGHIEAPKATSDAKAPTLPPVKGDEMPPFLR